MSFSKNAMFLDDELSRLTIANPKTPKPQNPKTPIYSIKIEILNRQT